MSRRPHEHYYIDQVDTHLWVVVCATCETTPDGGLIGAVADPRDYDLLATGHWEEEVLRV